jgi:hypothetical protein
MTRVAMRAVSEAQDFSEAAYRALIEQGARSLAGGGPLLRCAGGCVGYHRGWLVLQQLGLISGLSSERGFIVEAIRAAAARRPVRTVQIAGCADFGLLSVLHEALGQAVGDVSITVRDRCETPLALCRLYAAHGGFDIECEAGDLIAGASDSRFDLVLAHSLLSFCTAQERGRLLARLAAQLMPDGTLLLYQSVRPSAVSAVLAYGAAETAAMVGRALDEGHALAAAAGWSHAEVEAFVRAFCDAKRTWAVPSAASVIADAEAQGLVLRGCRLLLDSASSAHRAATPAMRHLKYEFALGAGAEHAG